MITRAEMLAAIAAGGSVLLGGRIITRVEDLPVEDAEAPPIHPSIPAELADETVQIVEIPTGDLVESQADPTELGDQVDATVESQAEAVAPVKKKAKG